MFDFGNLKVIDFVRFLKVDMGINSQTTSENTAQIIENTGQIIVRFFLIF